MIDVTIKSVISLILGRVTAIVLALFTSHYINLHIDLTYFDVIFKGHAVRAICLFALFFPRYVFQIIEMLVYWFISIKFMRMYFNIPSDMLLFLIGIAITTLAKSIGVLKYVINAIIYILKLIIWLIFKIPIFSRLKKRITSL